MTVVSALDRAPSLEDDRVLPRSIDDQAITGLVCAPLMRSAGGLWWIAFLVCSATTYLARVVNSDHDPGSRL